MHRTDILLYLLMPVLIITSCIRSYDPEILAQDEKKYVITGAVAEGDSVQTVNVSISSPIDKPKYIPVTGCEVQILDDQGHEFPMSDAGDGNYKTSVDPAYMVPGVSFRVVIRTPEGDDIESDFDRLPEGPEIDSVYYLRKDIEGNQPGQYTLGIQFYVDLRASTSDSRYFRWEAIETWEYHADRPLEWYYDGIVHHVVPPDSSRMVCWRTLRVPDIFTLPTDNLTENRYDMFPLHYVNNRTPKLANGYSLLIKQFAHSQAAFIYWEQLRVNSDPEGGLYQKQPLAIRGNMRNLTHPEKEVLGFFAAASVRSKRIFIREVEGLPLDFTNYCDFIILRAGLREIAPRFYPAFLDGNEITWFPIWLDNECVNCLILGGKNVKPDFWPN